MRGAADKVLEQDRAAWSIRSEQHGVSGQSSMEYQVRAEQHGVSIQSSTGYQLSEFGAKLMRVYTRQKEKPKLMHLQILDLKCSLLL